ncbi:MAG: DNA topoisomerase IB [Geminicoccaceae bacterium]
MLAVGYDQKNRRQYIYNPAFRQEREAEKFAQLRLFSLKLPKIRARLAYDRRHAETERIRVAALCLTLIDKTAIRVGSMIYRKTNGTYGATTLLKRHVSITGPKIRLQFIGKGGKKRHISFSDGLLARDLRRLKTAPGPDLFRYRAADGSWTTLSSSTVNAYLQERSGLDITAKAFRIWKATTIAAEVLTEKGTGSPIKPALKKAAEALDNTPAMVRSSYLHPKIIETHKAGELQEMVEQGDGRAHLKATEQAVRDLLDVDGQPTCRRTSELRRPEPD